MNYLKILVEDIHSVVLGTLDRNNKVATRVIDLMYEDGKTVYFLTANTKLMYEQLLENPFVSVTGLTVGSDTMKRKSITLQGKVQCIGKTNLDILLKKNPYMLDIYPTEKSREVLEVFCFEYAQGEFYDLTTLPPKVASFVIRK